MRVSVQDVIISDDLQNKGWFPMLWLGYAAVVYCSSFSLAAAFLFSVLVATKTLEESVDDVDTNYAIIDCTVSSSRAHVSSAHVMGSSLEKDAKSSVAHV
mmetsp:Transcript_13429/g.18607  ORF Transcript_13429/g.18607 Transcript_13429/m.18607 type:complete len:100 (+) Transcript_13429:64-363(+)